MEKIMSFFDSWSGSYSIFESECQEIQMFSVSEGYDEVPV